MNPPQGSLIWWAAVVVIAIGGLWLLGVALNIFGTIFTWVEWTFSSWNRQIFGKDYDPRHWEKPPPPTADPAKKPVNKDR